MTDDVDRSPLEYNVNGVIYREFYCATCGDWMPIFIDAWSNPDSPYCGRCGEAFTCGECGYEIDLEGNCQRPPASCEKCGGQGEVTIGTHQDRFSGVWETETGRCDDCDGTGRKTCPTTREKEG